MPMMREIAGLGVDHKRIGEGYIPARTKVRVWFSFGMKSLGYLLLMHELVSMRGSRHSLESRTRVDVHYLGLNLTKSLERVEELGGFGGALSSQ